MIRKSSILILNIAILFTFLKCTTGKKEESAQVGGATKGMPVGINAIVIKPEFLENNIYATGTVLPNEEVELRSEISGRVIGIYFKEDAPVSKGQLLVKINDSDFQAQLKKLKLQEKLAAEDESRKSKLLEVRGISQEEYDRALHLVNSLKADVDLLESQIAKTEIRAPFNGVIGLRYISEGGFISPTALIATMQELNPIKVEFSIPEKYSYLVKKGSKIEFSIEGSERKYIGSVYAASTKIDLNTRSLTVRAQAPNPDRSLTPGAFVKIQFTLENIKEAVMIPTEALIPELGGQKVYVIQGDSIRGVKVETGIRTKKEIQITKGLNPNDTIAITGILQIKDKSKVKINEIVLKDSLKISTQTN